MSTGDTIYIPHGVVHAIGPGLTVFETQQASDLTYRMFDYNRPSDLLDGKPRELNVRKAADVLNYKAATGGLLGQIPYHFEGLDRTALIADSHFVVERIVARGEPATMATNARPLIVMTLDAPMEVGSPEGNRHAPTLSNRPDCGRFAMVHRARRARATLRRLCL